MSDAAELALSSTAFAPGARIPPRHTCEGADISPPLAWTDPPEGTRSFALVVDDPDAPGGSFTHWLAWDLPPSSRGLPEGRRAPSEGRNDFATPGWRGPCPPRGHGRHRYAFRLYALDAGFILKLGADRRHFEQAVQGHVLAEAELVGTYERR